MTFANHAEKRHAAGTRQHQVEYHQIEVIVTFELLTGLLSIFGTQHLGGIIGCFQRLQCQHEAFAHQRMVFDYQNPHFPLPPLRVELS